METKLEDKYHFISENPSIYILTSRLERLFDMIDTDKDAILQMGNLVASIPPRLYTKYKIKELINERDEQATTILTDLNNQISAIPEWSQSHKDQYIQQKLKEFNIETYQLIANIVTAIIDELYIHEEERKEHEEKQKEHNSIMHGILS